MDHSLITELRVLLELKFDLTIITCLTQTNELTAAEKRRSVYAYSSAMAAAPRVLSDADVAKLPMATVVDCMERTLMRHAAGQLVAPARLSTGPLGVAGPEAPLEAQHQLARDQRVNAEGAGELVFTPGAIPGAIGFRVYDLVQLSSPARVELVAVLSTVDGSLTSLVAGPLLGAMRTGGIGGAALRHLARADASILTLVGAGYQARTQLMAACATRSWSEVRIWSRRRKQAEAFVAEMTELVTEGSLPEGGITVIAGDTAEGAVRGADVVICTTTATSPVLETDWLAPGTHITNVGPKFSDGAELPLDLYANAVGCTDAVLQCQSIGDRFVLSDAGTGTAAAMQSLPEIVAGSTPGLGRQSDDDTTVFISMGLAGTEVALAAEPLDVASLAKL